MTTGSVVVAGLAAALAAAFATADGRRPTRRLTAGSGSAALSTPAEAGEPDESGAAWIERPWARAAVCACSGAAAGQALGGGLRLVLAGLVVGAVCSWLVGRLEPPSVRRRRERLEADLPLAVDLLAACARAGVPALAALDIVAAAVGGPLGERFSRYAARVRLGADPVDEWRRLRADPEVGMLARAMARSADSGAALVVSLDRLAIDVRAQRALTLQRRARSVGVRAAGPLGLCFLPAFMLVGVVPTVVGGFERLVL